MSCPTANPRHQPHPEPWWSGRSLFRDLLRPREQPSGPFYHAILNPQWNHGLLSVGESLSSPAARKLLPERLKGKLEADGCLSYLNYDVHGVYVTTKWEAVAGYSYYEVLPRGELWRDPEQNFAGGSAWCCESAEIIAVHTTDLFHRR